MQDVLPPNDHRSIRNIPVTKRRPEPRQEEFHPENAEHYSSYERPRRNIWLWGAALVVACILIGMLVASLFAGATVTVNPREAAISLPVTLQAGLDAPVGALSYQTISVPQSAHRTVPSSGMRQVNSSAQGQVTIYNAYSTASQTLVASTRLEAPDGKIYRIHLSVVVPGEKKTSSGTVPGSVSVTAYADAAGADYNRGSARFTIPGFRGSPRYSGFYAQTSGMSGGASGTEPSVADSDLQTAKLAMEQEIAQGTAAAAASQIPDGSIAVQNARSYEYGDIVIADAGNGQATLTESATATEALVRQSDVANAIAKIQVQGYGGEPVNFSDPSKVAIVVATGSSFDPGGSSLSLAVSGPSSLLWQYDQNQLAVALAGKKKSDFDSIIKTFSPAIAKATASVRPFWEQNFPSDPKKITVKQSLQF